MSNRVSRVWLAALCAVMGFSLAAPGARAEAQQYGLDTTHTAFVFSIKHLGMSYTYGRFNDVKGEIAIDPDNPGACNFFFSIGTDSVDTGLQKRDDHLRSPDFFNAKQFPVITFKTGKVEAAENGYRVTGVLSLHGVAKTITIDLEKLGEGKDPWGNYRIGFATMLKIKRSDYGMTNMMEAVGDEVKLMISFEGIKQ